MKFKVGDIVKGNSGNRYGYTNSDMTKAKVIEVAPEDERDIYIEILEHKYQGNVGEKYWVNSQFFDLVKEPKLKVGDVVRIKDLKIETRYGGLTYLPEMRKYAGKQVSISSFDGGNFYNLEDLPFSWSSEMLELVEDVKPSKGITLKAKAVEPVIDKRFKIGDKVVIRKDLKVGECGIDSVIEDMLRYRGQLMTISNVVTTFKGYKYSLKDDATHCNWTYEMFEPTGISLKPAEQFTPKYKVGDKVRIVSASCGWAGVSKGDIGTIKRIPKDK